MKIFTTCLIVLSLILPLAMAAAEDLPKAKLKTFDVARVTLTEPFTKQVDGKSVTFTEGFLVRFHGDFAIRGANTMHLQIGQESIEEYGGLPDGLYFIIYDAARFERMKSQPIQFRFGKTDSWKDFGKTFDPSSFDLKTVKSEADALKAE